MNLTINFEVHQRQNQLTRSVREYMCLDDALADYLHKYAAFMLEHREATPLDFARQCWIVDLRDR